MELSIEMLGKNAMTTTKCRMMDALLTAWLSMAGNAGITADSQRLIVH